MKMKNRLKLLSFLVILCVITACSYGGSENPSNTSDNPNENDNGKSGGKVSIPIVADPTFNPWHPSVFAESNLINRVLFDGLTKPGHDLSPTPDLAEDWDTSEDGLVWTFHLRKDVKWHDGEQFTADDVAFTFNEIVLNKDLGANGAGRYEKVKNVEVINDYTVQFNLTTPYAALPSYLSYNSEIIPEHIFAGEDPWNLTSFNKENPVGTGPFKMKSYTSGQGLVLERNEDYFGDVAFLDELEYKVLSDTNTHVAQLLSGELDIFALGDTSSLERIKNSEGISISGAERPQFYWLIANQKLEKFQDKRVRQAILHAIDRQNIIDIVLNGYATVADAGIAPALGSYYTDDVKHYEYNPEKAKELLAEAGWEDTNGDGFVDKEGKNFTIDFAIGIHGDLESIAQLVQQYLIDVGLDVELNTMEWNTMIDQVVVQRDYELSLNWWLYTADPDLLTYMASYGDRNLPAYSNEELDRLLEAGSETSEVSERKEIYIEAQKLMAEELNYIYLWYPQEIRVSQEKLKGLPDMAFGDSLHYVNEWYFEE
jgi:peptide/nickel transport system substrate-binding protein